VRDPNFVDLGSMPAVAAERFPPSNQQQAPMAPQPMAPQAPMAPPAMSQDEINAPPGYKFAGYAPAPEVGESNPG